MKRVRNWWDELHPGEKKWGSVFFAIGLAGVMAGFLLVEDHGASVLLELGAAVMLAVPLLALERRISNEVREAREAAASAREEARAAMTAAQGRYRGPAALARALSDRFDRSGDRDALLSIWDFGLSNGLDQEQLKYEHPLGEGRRVVCDMTTLGPRLWVSRGATGEARPEGFVKIWEARQHRDEFIAAAVEEFEWWSEMSSGAMREADVGEVLIGWIDYMIAAIEEGATAGES